MITKLDKLTPKEVAGVLGCSVYFVREEIKRGTIPAIRINKRVFWVLRSELDAYIGSRMRRAA